MNNKIRVVINGAFAHVFLPDGSQLWGVLGAKVEIGCPGDISKLVLELSDFSVEASIDLKSKDTKRDPIGA